MRTSIAAALVVLAGWAATAAAQEPTRLKLSLEFRPYGGTAATINTEVGGFFKAEGLEVKVDGSAGSGDAITRVAAGAYDVGIADVGALVEFAARNPAAAPKAVLLLFDRAAHVIVALKTSGIARPADLLGKRLVTGQSDATVRIFPSFLKRNGIDGSKITQIPMDVRLRDSMLLRGEADAILGFSYTVIFNLVAQKVPFDDITTISLGDYGFDFYGNALIVSRALIDTRPEIVRKVARAVARGWVASIRDPQAAIAAVVKTDPLTPAALELQRFQYVIDRHVATAATRAGGLGAYDEAKLRHTIRAIVEGFGLARVPEPDEIYDARFLPPLPDRRF
jgi:NitT/TauT family transport system substrate-binding protein